MSFSQNNEEAIILSYFAGKVGRCLDIGAYTGTDLSNTRALMLGGWTGVMVDPSPKPFAALLDTYRGNDKATLVNAAVVATREGLDAAGMIELHDSNGDALSTTFVGHKDKWAGTGVPWWPFKVAAITVVDFMAVYGSAFDFVSLDVEGKNVELFDTMASLGFFANVQMLCIEHDGLDQHIESQLSPLGFRRLDYNGENVILAR